MEDILLSGSFLLFILGMMLLFSIFYISEPEEYEIVELLESDIEHFRTYGYVRDVAERGSVVFIKLEEQCYLEGMLFPDGKTNYNSLVNQFIRVRGHTNEYEGQKQYIFTDIQS